MSRRPRALRAALSVLTATVVASLLIVGGAAPASSSGPPIDDGVTVRTETFVDRDRETPAVSGLQLPAKKSRTLTTTIWAPSERGKYPLIVFAHGCNGHGRDYEPMLRTWAAAGYVVAAPDFPVSSLGAPGVACTSDVSHQPDDVSFVIDRVLALDRARDGLGRIVDRRKIGVAGHSLGGVTTLGVAFRSCCHDERIDAAIPYAGTPLIYGTDFRGMRTPLLLVHGDADPTVRYTGSVGPFTKARGPRYLLTILGGDHGSYLFNDDAVSDAVQRASLDFWAGYLGDDADALARLETDAVVPGATTLQEAG